MIRARSFIAQDAPFGIGLWADAGTVSIPADVDAVSTSGFSQAGIGGAVYTRAQALPLYNAGFQTADGSFWEIVSEQGVLITQFGALPDTVMVRIPIVNPQLGNPTATVTNGTDNNSTIQNALDYITSLPGGGTVYVPQGVFGKGANSSIFVRSNTVFEGLGGWIVRFNSTSLSLPEAVIRSDDSLNVVIRGINVEANRGGQTTILGSSHTIRLHHVNNLLITFCQLYSSTSYTISSDIQTQKLKVTFCGIYNSCADGIDTHNTGLGVADMLYMGNIIDGFAFGGVTKAGIHGRGSALAIIGNIIRNCAALTAGIAGIIMGNGEAEDGQKCIGNEVAMGPLPASGNLSNGIVWNNPNAVITGNTVVGDTGTQTGYSANVANGTVVANVVVCANGKTVSVTRDGFNFGVTSANYVIGLNNADGCGDDAFNDLGSGNKYSNNTATNCGGYAFNMLSSTGALLDDLNTQVNCTSGLLRRGTGTKLDQSTDVGDTPTLAQLNIGTPTIATHAVPLAFLQSYVAGYYSPLTSGAVVSHTGDTSEFILYTLPVAANFMALNGAFRFEMVFQFVGSAATKSIGVKFGQMAGTVQTLTGITVAAGSKSFRLICTLGNANSATAQIGGPSNLGSYGASGSDPQELTIDTTVDENIYVVCTNGNAGDTTKLRWGNFQYFPGFPVP